MECNCVEKKEIDIIVKKIELLKKLLKKQNFDGYILPSTDEYLNEYVPDYNRRLKWLTNFSGSSGILFIIKNELLFFTDGRYTFQAKKELPKTFKIIDSSKENIFNWIKLNLYKKKVKILIDSQINSFSFINKLDLLFAAIKSKLIIKDQIFIDKLWKRDITFKEDSVYFLPKKYTGLSFCEKIKKIKISLSKADLSLITSSESVSWLLNLRGNDLENTPLVFSNLLINKKKRHILFINEKKVDKNIKIKLEKNYDLEILSLESLKQKLINESKNKTILLPKNSPYFFYNILKSHQTKIIWGEDLCLSHKSIKNHIELKNIKECHVSDAVALVKFFCWLEKYDLSKNLNEVYVSKKLEEFRKKNKNFISPSFPTISAFGENAAIIHYCPQEKSSKSFKEGQLYLCDSGGQYLYGTTDVTRTVLIGKKTKYLNEFQENYTRVLIGHINLTSLKFPDDTKGSQIDSIARIALWETFKDYAHGTGHGVGSFLSVHEGPQSISRATNDTVLKSGMIVSIEPGYYKEKNYGIRLENLVVVKKTIHKRFLTFEPLTLVPFQKKLINKKIMNSSQVIWLNKYHKFVYDKLKKFLSKSEKIWLLNQTKPI